MPAKKVKTAAKKSAAKPAVNLLAAQLDVVCDYEKRIGDAPPPPTVETHGPVVEKEDVELQPVS